MERKYYRINVNKIIDDDRYFLRPYGINEKGISQSLYKYLYLNEPLDDILLGEKVLECLEMSKHFTKDELTTKSNDYVNSIKQNKLKDFDNNSFDITVEYVISEKKYRIIKSYKVSNKGYMNKKGDPEHILPGNATALEIGKTIRLAFTDISVDKKDR